MTRSLNFRGMSPSEVEDAARKIIAKHQAEWEADYENDLIDSGAGPDEIAVRLARRRAEDLRWREHAIEGLRATAARGSGGELN